jgi:hypothetical protein
LYHARVRGKVAATLTDSRLTHYHPPPQAGFLAPLSTGQPLRLMRLLRQLNGKV